MTIRIIVKEIRLKKDLSLRDLEKKCGIAKSTLSNIENNNTDAKVSTLCKIAKGIGCSLDELVKY